MSKVTNCGANPVLALEVDRNWQCDEKDDETRSGLATHQQPLAGTLPRHPRGHRRCAHRSRWMLASRP